MLHNGSTSTLYVLQHSVMVVAIVFVEMYVSFRAVSFKRTGTKLPKYPYRWTLSQMPVVYVSQINRTMSISLNCAHARRAIDFYVQPTDTYIYD